MITVVNKAPIIRFCDLKIGDHFYYVDDPMVIKMRITPVTLHETPGDLYTTVDITGPNAGHISHPSTAAREVVKVNGTPTIEE